VADQPGEEGEGATLQALRARLRDLEQQNARLMAQVAEQRQLAEAGRVATIAVLEGLELQDVLHTLLDALAGLVPFDAACVMMLDEHGQVSVQAGIGYSPAIVPGTLVFDIAELPHLEELVQGMHSVYVPDTTKHRGWRMGVSVSAETRSWLGVPLIARGQVLGLYAIDKRQPEFFRAKHIELAEALAVHAALAVANALVYAELTAD
jgi:GAF domain-containing protein